MNTILWYVTYQLILVNNPPPARFIARSTNILPADLQRLF
jgi:hypothetical protein